VVDQLIRGRHFREHALNAAGGLGLHIFIFLSCSIREFGGAALAVIIAQIDCAVNQRRKSGR
jgi:hypothetical protein